MLKRFVLSAIAVLCVTTAHAQVYASLVLVHGHVWTENPAQPETEAIAIAGNHILQTGTSAEVLRLAGPSTRVIDLHGRRVVPGFNDAHVHFVTGGLVLANVQLLDASSQAEFRDRMGRFGRLDPFRHLGSRTLDACRAPNPSVDR
jgi:predicted amidohydrolase YtcJ